MKKEKICTGCGKSVLSFWKKGLCKFCASKTHKKLSSKPSKYKAEIRDEMEEYFSYHIGRCSRSENSNEVIYSPNRSNICHIFPKSKYKSVRSLKENCVYLSLEEHTLFDSLLDRGKVEEIKEKFSAQFLEVLRERINKILPLVEESGGVKETLKKLKSLEGKL